MGNYIIKNTFILKIFSYSSYDQENWYRTYLGDLIKWMIMVPGACESIFDFYSSYSNYWRSWSWMILWRPTRPFRTNTQKRCTFHYRGLECESRKSRNTWSNRQIWPWRTEWSRAKASNSFAKRTHWS